MIDDKKKMSIIIDECKSKILGIMEREVYFILANIQNFRKLMKFLWINFRIFKKFTDGNIMKRKFDRV